MNTDLSQVPPETIDNILDELEQNEILQASILPLSEMQRSSSTVSNKETVAIDKCPAENPIIDNCIEINRLTNALRFYVQLNFEQHKGDKEKLIEYCNVVYKELLNDYIHLVTQHTDDLEQIHTDLVQKHDFITCDVNKCNFTDRHYRHSSIHTEDKMSNLSETSDFTFYRDTFDSVHYYLFHLFHVGLRIKQKAESKSNTEMKKDTTTNQQLKSSIKPNKPQSKDLQRFNSNKFTINISNNNAAINDQNDTTYIDLMVQYLKMNETSQDKLNLLTCYLKDNEYDSDAVKQDMSNDKQSNISKHINNELIDSIAKYIRYTKITSGSFSVGLIFYYWPYYKKLANEKTESRIVNKIPEKTNENNVNDHSGYSIKKLYVEKKYSTFKNEILQHLSIQQYNEDVREKALKYTDTDKAKSIKAADGSKMNLRHLKYNIKYGRVIQIHHLMSLILYCDFSELSKAFSATFRPILTFEPLSSIKKRNQNYWYLSKYLRETVQYYGECKYYDKVCGPFFCGMSCVMAFPQYNIRLCSPTSTSIQVVVAAKFGGDKGILIQMNNNGDRMSSKYLRFFNCSWISRYKEEDERLFVGGDRRIRIESIRDLSNHRNYAVFFHALFYFDCMINGGMMNKSEMNISSTDKFIIDSLIKYQIGATTECKIYDYIKDTFKLFCIKKTQIIINMSHLFEYFKGFSDLILCSVEKTYVDDYKNNDYYYRNVIREVLFKLFPNVEKLIIYSTHWTGDFSYAFSFKPFGKLLHNYNTSDSLEVIIKASHNWRFKDKRSWIWHIWSHPNGSILKRQFNKFTNSKWQIGLKITKNSQDREEDCLIIKRK